MGQKATDLMKTIRWPGCQKDTHVFLGKPAFFKPAFFIACRNKRPDQEESIMKRINTQFVGLVVITMLGIALISTNALALDWVYSYDAYNDASASWEYEVYRMGYAFDEEYLYFNMLTGVPQNGRGAIQPGDLFINVGGSLLDGYTGSGYDAAYKSGKVFGLALTDHSGDMNADLTPTNSAYKSGNADNGYAWSAVEKGHLYGDAFFSTGIYEGYESTSYWKQSKDNDGGTDAFGYANNAPVHIASFEDDLGYQGDVTWNYLGSTYVNEAKTVKKNAYEVNAKISLDSLGIVGGESFELWWSMECGNDFGMAAGTMPDRPVAAPEPGTLLLLGSGLLGGIMVARKRQK